MDIENFIMNNTQLHNIQYVEVTIIIMFVMLSSFDGSCHLRIQWDDDECVDAIVLYTGENLQYINIPLFCYIFDVCALSEIET